MRKLLSLDLSFNNLSGEFPKELLGNDEFTGGLITKKEFYAGMETFDVSNNKMTGKHPNGLAATTILLRANFRAKIGSAHAVELIYPFSWSEAGYDFVKPLRELYDSRSLMDSVLLEDKKYSELDYSNNNLTGVMEFRAIDALNLSHNHLTRLIPVSLSNLSQLESLDFSYFNFLEVAHNNLSGRVPGKGQFATFDINSYEGNPFLYGLPSEKNHTK
ncbi:hypothetical protein Golob_020830, partial [Gossypium lobatum]|nr:hypothetical protein [Gossypium lobatum]